jgi:hypothetical protein
MNLLAYINFSIIIHFSLWCANISYVLGSSLILLNVMTAVVYCVII